MSLNRRDFIKSAAVGGALLLKPSGLFGNHKRAMSGYFALHPFIESNPGAVFIMRTNVDAKTDSAALKQLGFSFGQSVFTLTDDAQKGVPLDYYFPIKPNITSWDWDVPRNVNVQFEQVMGVITDVHFVEGIIDSMKALKINSDKMFIGDANGKVNYDAAGYTDFMDRTGVNVQLNKSNPQLQWVDVPDGGWFKRIPYLWPYNDPNSWLLNVAKLKAHSMGLTLCSKNLQGAIAHPYVAHCSAWGKSMGIATEHIQPYAFDEIKANYIRHKNDGYQRWDVYNNDVSGGLGMETWATRCLDNNSVLKPGLNIIEGVYGRDGNGFYKGPQNGIGRDFMTNVIIFGKNSFLVDIIGKWIGGHEPGNFGLFHMAKERGFIENLNPHEIPLYEWNVQGQATLANLTNFDRTPLLTKYLTKPGEEQWHMVDEPFEYVLTAVSRRKVNKPESYVLQQNYPNPLNPSTTIHFSIPNSGNAQLEIFNSRGEIVDVLHDGFKARGNHMVVWDAKNASSGTYFYRFRCDSFTETRKMTLVR